MENTYENEQFKMDPVILGYKYDNGDVSISELFDLFVATSPLANNQYTIAFWAISENRVYFDEKLQRYHDDEFNLKLYREEQEFFERMVDKGYRTYHLCVQQPIEECRRVLQREWNNL